MCLTASRVSRSQLNLQAEGLLEQQTVLLQGELFERKVFNVRNRNYKSVIVALAIQVRNSLAIRSIERDGDSLCTDKQREAVWRIQFLAEIQCILMGEMESMDDLGDPEDGDDEEHGKGADIDHGPMHDGPIPPLS